MNLPEDFIFSQSALQDYIACERRFELRHIEDLRWPALETDPPQKYEASIVKGQEFHHFVHQHSLEVPGSSIEPTIDDDDLRRWWGNYLRWRAIQPTADRYPELMLTTPFAGFMLAAKYDLIAKMPDSTFLIIDWKTGKPQKRAALAGNMQSIVYPYVLARAGAWLNDGELIPPARIRMLYWFADDGSTVEFEIDEAALERSEAKLKSLIEKIHVQTDFPLTEDKRLCEYCEFRSFCDRGIKAGRFDDFSVDPELSERLSFDLDEIEEIAF